MEDKQLKLFYNSQDNEEGDTGKRRLIKIPLDNLLLLGIINVFIIIISFSLGIERGRKIIPAKEVKRLRTETDSTSVATIEYQQKDYLKKKTTTGDELKKQINKEKKREYIVQVGCYSQPNIAEKEKDRLVRAGFTVSISKQGKWLVVSVGKFNSKQEAEKTKLILRKRYSDCYLRRL